MLFIASPLIGRFDADVQRPPRNVQPGRAAERVSKAGIAVTTDAGGTGGTAAVAAARDAKLLQLGLQSAIDRRRVMAIILGEEDFPSLINWYKVCNVLFRPFFPVVQLDFVHMSWCTRGGLDESNVGCVRACVRVAVHYYAY